MGLTTLQLAEKLTGDEMDRLFQTVFEKYDQPFEVLEVEKLAPGKLVHVKLQNGLKHKVTV